MNAAQDFDTTQRSSAERPIAIIGSGEALIDMIGEKGEPDKLTAHPGGGVANMCAAAAKLGCPSTFLGAFGSDTMASIIQRALTNAGVRPDGFLTLPGAQTAIALVSIADDGNRSFAFYRNKTADLEITVDDMDKSIAKMQDAWKQALILHSSSVSMSAEPGRSAQMHTMQRAKEDGLTVAFDPNVRLNLWDDHNILRDCIRKVLPLVDILKISEEEVPFVLGEELREGARSTNEIIGYIERLRSYAELPVILLTRGPRGSILFIDHNYYENNAYACKAKDTTGAGDAAMGGLLAGIVEGYEAGVQGAGEAPHTPTPSLMDWLKDVHPETAHGLVDWSNAVASYSTQSHGGIASYGSKEEVLAFSKNYKKN